MSLTWKVFLAKESYIIVEQFYPLGKTRERFETKVSGGPKKQNENVFLIAQIFKETSWFKVSEWYRKVGGFR